MKKINVNNNNISIQPARAVLKQNVGKIEDLSIV